MQPDEQRARGRQRIAREAADDRADETLEADQEAGVVVDRRDRADQHAAERAEQRRERERQRAGEVGEMPHRRAPARFTAVARSALPYSVRPKNSVQRDDQRHAGPDTSRLCTFTLTAPTVNDARRERRRARALGAEEPQAEADQRKVHGDRNDQQHEHGRFGERLVRDPVEQRPERRDRGQRRARPARQRQMTGASHQSSAATASGTPDHSRSARGMRRASPRAGSARPPSGRRRTAMPDEEADGARRLAELQARQASACRTPRTRRTARRSRA